MSSRSLFTLTLALLLLLLLFIDTGNGQQCANHTALFPASWPSTIPPCTVSYRYNGVLYVDSNLATRAPDGALMITFSSNTTDQISAMAYVPCPSETAFDNLGPSGKWTVRFSLDSQQVGGDPLSLPQLTLAHVGTNPNNSADTDYDVLSVVLNPSSEMHFWGSRRNITWNLDPVTDGLPPWLQSSNMTNGTIYQIDIDYSGEVTSDPILQISIDGTLVYTLHRSVLIAKNISFSPQELVFEPGHMLVYVDTYDNGTFGNQAVWTVHSSTFICNRTLSSPTTPSATTPSTSPTPSTSSTSINSSANVTTTPAPTTPQSPPAQCVANLTVAASQSCVNGAVVISTGMTITNLTITDMGACGGCTGVLINGTLDINAEGKMRIPYSSTTPFVYVTGCVRFAKGSVIEVMNVNATIDKASLKILSASCIEGLENVSILIGSGASSPKYCLNEPSQTNNGGRFDLLLNVSTACGTKKRRKIIVVIAVVVSLVLLALFVAAILLSRFWSGCSRWLKFSTESYEIKLDHQR